MHIFSMQGFLQAQSGPSGLDCVWQLVDGLHGQSDYRLGDTGEKIADLLLKYWAP